MRAPTPDDLPYDVLAFMQRVVADDDVASASSFGVAFQVRRAVQDLSVRIATESMANKIAMLRELRKAFREIRKIVYDVRSAYDLASHAGLLGNMSVRVTPCMIRYHASGSTASCVSCVRRTVRMDLTFVSGMLFCMRPRLQLHTRHSTVSAVIDAVAKMNVAFNVVDIKSQPTSEVDIARVLHEILSCV